jgi:putative peptide zinc metalloprotease protein
MSNAEIDNMPPLFSPHWYRVRQLLPALKTHASISRHDYRGEIWHVVSDKSSGRQHRFNQAAWQFIGLMDGKHSVSALWDQLNNKLGDDAPTQDDIINILAQLHAADLLLCDITPALGELFTRSEKRDKAKRHSRWKNPLAMRFPLWDANSFLDRSWPAIAPLLSRNALKLSMVSIVLAMLLALSHWSSIQSAVVNQGLQAYSLGLMLIAYIVMKALHELGHAYAVKREGGEVHEVGITLLMLLPLPYVDASASASFRQRRHRMLVAAMGIIVELQLSAFALFLWLAVEPGIVSDLALNIMLVGGVSTLLFNGNPLLRYDAYYVLSDLLGIPNLAQRGNRYIGFLLQRYVFGLTTAKSPVSAPGEAPWLAGYSILSFCYRTALMLGIAVYLAGQYFVLGVVLALWALAHQMLLPLIKHSAFLFSAQLAPKRARALGVTTTVCASLAVLIFALPLPSNTQYQGVVWLPGDKRINSDVDAFVARVLAQPGQQVVKDQPLLQLQEPALSSEAERRRARVDELRAELNANRHSDKVKAAALRASLQSAEAELQHAKNKVAALLIKSPANGEFVLAGADDLTGQYVRQGELIAYVLDEALSNTQVPVTQDDMDRLQQGIEAVEVRLASNLQEVLPARVIRSTPQASRQLPSAALSTSGGGLIATDPADESNLRSLETLFQFELELPLAVSEAKLGTRVYVRFKHQSEPLASQLYRRIRQLFLRQFHV